MADKVEQCPNCEAERKRRVEAEAERDDAKRSREHTHDWYARHYGKLQDWARKRLPEPWQTEFFNCVANGTWGFDDVGTPYMTMVGKVTPSGYFVMDEAYKQLLSDQTVRAEAAEASVEQLGGDLKAAQMDYANEHRLREAAEANCRNLESALEEARKEARMWEERAKEGKGL